MRYPIDWKALVRSLCPHLGDKTALATQMQRDGIPIKADLIRGWAAVSRNANPHGDAAVWLVKEAERLGFEIPEKK